MIEISCAACGCTLTAKAATGKQFTGWSGACSGTGSCHVTMTAAKAVTATFIKVSAAERRFSSELRG